MNFNFKNKNKIKGNMRFSETFDFFSMFLDSSAQIWI